MNQKRVEKQTEFNYSEKIPLGMKFFLLTVIKIFVIFNG